MRKSILFLLFLVSTFVVKAQDHWEFRNSTPYQTVKSHFYFLEKGSHYNPLLASYTLYDFEAPQSKKEALIIKLRDILVAMHLNLDEVLDRRRGIVDPNKYQLFSYEPSIYLIRVSRKWVYSPETVKKIPKLYDKYVLKIKNGHTPNQKIEKHIIAQKLASDSGKVTLDLSTPFNTISSHLIFLSDSLFDPKKAAKTINFDPADTADAPDLALKLKQIFQGAHRQLFDFDAIPKDSNYVDTASGNAIYYPNPEIPELYLEKINGKWYYSRTTSKLIRSVHKKMYSGDAEEVFSFSDKFRRMAGVKNNNIVFFEFRLWQIYMLGYFLLIYLLLYLVNRFVTKPLSSHLNIYRPYRHLVYKIIKNSSYLIFLNYALIYAPSFEFSVEYSFVLLRIINLLIIFYYTLLSFNIIDLLKEIFIRGHLYDSRFGMVIFASLIAKTIAITVSLLFIVKEFDFNVVNFLAGLSIGGFALAFGAQDTIKNFLGSLMIFADKSFSVGDWIDNGNVSGTVEEIGLRSTRIRTFYNSLVTVPNSLLSDKSIDNLGKRKYRRYKTKLILKYDTPLDKVEEFIERIKKIIEEHPDTRKDYYMVYMNELGSYGLEVLLYLFFKVPTWNLELKARHEIIAKVLETQRELGIELAIPLVSKADL
jgi:MscS family membrane protein